MKAQRVSPQNVIKSIWAPSPRMPISLHTKLFSGSSPKEIIFHNLSRFITRASAKNKKHILRKSFHLGECSRHCWISSGVMLCYVGKKTNEKVLTPQARTLHVSCGTLSCGKYDNILIRAFSHTPRAPAHELKLQWEIIISDVGRQDSR